MLTVVPLKPKTNWFNQFLKQPKEADLQYDGLRKSENSAISTRDLEIDKNIGLFVIGIEEIGLKAPYITSMTQIIPLATCPFFGMP